MTIKNKRKKLKLVLVGIGAVILVCMIAGLTFIGIQIGKAPDISEVDATPDGYLSTILDRNENLMNTLYVSESNRVYVDLEYIPVELQKAFVAIEDARFYDHNGIDIKGIFRAAFVGLKKGSFSQGASTITQQLLKNNVFTDWMAEETFYDRLCRKIQEQYLAVRLEQGYSKEWILENYLNTINLGGGTRGVQVAAQHYFGKSVSDLTLAESALIAGITKNPTAYNPLQHPEKSLERQKLVLNAMLEQEFITQEMYDQAISEDVLAGLPADSANRGMPVLSWFEDALLIQVVEDLMEQYGYTEADAWDMIYTGGLVIYSTQDTRLQKLCETEAIDPKWYSEDQEISLVLTDVSTGAVSAIVGSSKEKTASLAYNRATEAIRQPGSTIKVIGEYAAAIDREKVTLGTVLDDSPYTYSDGTEIHNAYSTYKGMTTIRESIASSGNVAALKTYQLVGPDQVFDYLQRFGISTLTEADKNEALSIGGTYHGVTNLELTAAYNAIANEGQYIRPYFYTKVLDRKGNIVLEQTYEYKQVITKESAALLTSAMEDVLTSGTGRDAAVQGLTLAGKSGTTNGNKDLWFVGYSSSYTLGIWGGHDTNEDQSESKYVKKIWKAVMEQAHEQKSRDALSDMSGFVIKNICAKCGNLAIEGLCKKSMQGNMERQEYYKKGTEPKTRCDCHVKVTICQESQLKAGAFCPNADVVENVYLKTGTAGTADEAYVLPAHLDGAAENESCDVHKNLWDTWFGEDADDSDEAPDNPQDPDEENRNWWDDLFGVWR